MDSSLLKKVNAEEIQIFSVRVQKLTFRIEKCVKIISVPNMYSKFENLEQRKNYEVQ